MLQVCTCVVCCDRTVEMPLCIAVCGMAHPAVHFRDLFTKEKCPVKRLVSIARVYTSIGMLSICCSEHIAHSLLLLVLLIGGMEPNPGPAMNVLAICAMMVLSPRGRDSLDLAGETISNMCLVPGMLSRPDSVLLSCSGAPPVQVVWSSCSVMKQELSQPPWQVTCL